MLTQSESVTPLYVSQLGQGQDVVLLHGWGLHGGVWQALADRLSHRFRFHILDLPGHGYSRFGKDGFDLDAAVDAVAETVQATGVKSPVLLGWSLGGLIGWQLARRYPALFSALVLVATTPSFVCRAHWPFGMPPADLELFAQQLHADYRLTVLRFLALQAKGDKYARQNTRQLRESVFARGEPSAVALASGLDILRTTDLTTGFSDSAPPTLLLGGQRDVLVSPKALQATAGQTNNARLSLIAGAGHAPFLSHPDEFIAQLEAFLPHAG